MRKLKITELNRMSVEEFKESDKLPLIVVLDDIRSLHNVGSVFRSSDAFRVEAIYLCGITAVPPQPEIHKTALGAEDTVDWRYFKDTLDAVKELKAEKPVIVSMGDYAASGGYYISCIADTIVAEPTTLTGSIGIFGMIPNVKELTDKVGLTYDVVKTNKFSDFGNIAQVHNSSVP